MGKITVCAVRNAFDPLASREIRRLNVGKSIHELMLEFYPGGFAGYHVEVAMDGARLNDTASFAIIPQDGSSVVFCVVPMGSGGKNPLAIVAMLAVMVAAPYAGGLLASAYYGAGITMAEALAFSSTTAMIANIGYAGAMIAGAYAVSAIFPASQPDTPASLDMSPTYAWEGGTNTVVEGVALPEIFGRCRVKPPLVGHYVTVEGDKQYLNLLYAVAGHRLDWCTEIRVNGTPIADLTDVESITGRDYRDGSPNQAVIQLFNDTRTDTAVGVKLTSTEDWTVRTTSGNTLNAIGVTFYMPKGLYFMDSNGKMNNHRIRVYVSYRNTANPDTEEYWIPYRVYTPVETTIVVPHWSAGYEYYETINPYGDNPTQELAWMELEADGTVQTEDHYENEPYVPSAWVVADNANAGRQVVYCWKWKTSGVHYTAGSTLADYVTIERNQMAPVYYTVPPVRVSNAGAEFAVRVKLVDELETSARYGTDIYWQTIREVVEDDFTFPGVALRAIRALATDQLSGSMPTVDMFAGRDYVPVWTGSQYEDKLAWHPAWACYHILHRARFKYNIDGYVDTTLAANYTVEGVPAARIDYAAFQAWSAWSWEKQYFCNINFDQSMSVRKALNILGTLGRGCVVQMGSKFTCIVDRIEQTPVQRFMFTVGNIVADSFQEEWLPVTDRANAIEVTFFDSTLDYERQMVTVYAQDFDTSEGEVNTLQATLYGCVDRTMAIKYGKFLINSNKYLTLTCSFEADVDAIACMPGDVIEVAHDVPQWGYSGRVVESASASVTVDRDIDITGATHYVRVKHQDDDTFEEKEILSVDGTGRTLTISGTWAKNPEAYALYSVGHIDAVVKLFRVLRITRSQEMRRKLTCIEYIAEVYEDGATIPEPEVISDLPLIDDLSVEEVYRGGAETKAALSWRGHALKWKVFWKLQSATFAAWTLAGETFNPSYEVSGMPYGMVVQFAVTPTDDPVDGESVLITMRGKIDPPGDVESIAVTQQGFNVIVTWPEVTDFDLWGYELRVVQVPYENEDEYWNYSGTLFKGRATTFTWKYDIAGIYLLQVRAVDAFGNYSVASAKEFFHINAPSIVSVSSVFSGPNAVLSWDTPASSFAIDRYDICYQLDPDDGSTQYPVGTTKSTTFSVNVDWAGVRYYRVVAYDIANNAGATGTVAVNVELPGTPSPQTPRVIDNNVLLFWTAPNTDGKLPISHYEVSKGDSYDESVDLGIVQATFSNIFEDTAGTYLYWIVAVDTAGNKGAGTSISASVNQPPDYVLLRSWKSVLGGTPSSAKVFEGALYAPVNTTETYQEHFVNNSFASPQAQVDGGYVAWITPVPTSGTYTEVFDYQALIDAQTKITLEISPATDVEDWGSITITPSIEVSTNGSTWETAVEAYQTIASNFRYVRITLTFAGTGGNDIKKINDINLKLDLKEITNSGTVNVTANPTTVTLTKSFVDVMSIILTPEGTAGLIAVYDFTDVPNPVDFDVYLFTHAGAAATGYVSWVVRGV